MVWCGVVVLCGGVLWCGVMWCGVVILPVRENINSSSLEC